MKKRRQSTAGFSLIEIAVVMVIVGVMFAAAIQAYMVYQEKSLQERTDHALSTIEQTLDAFYKAERRFPCPAPVNGATPGNDYDTENCSSGFTRANGANGEPILIGKLPAATLGLKNSYMKDVYQSYLTYAVTEAATTTGGRGHGAIILKEEEIDRAAGSPTQGELVEIEEHRNISYLVISAGKTRKGAYDHSGAQPIACSGAAKDRLNCDRNAIFITSLLSNVDNTDDANFYDDRVLFKKETDVSGSTYTSLRPAVRGRDYEVLDSSTFRMNREGYLAPSGTVATGDLQTAGTAKFPTTYYSLEPGDVLQQQVINGNAGNTTINGENVFATRTDNFGSPTLGPSNNPDLPQASGEEFFNLLVGATDNPSPLRNTNTQAGDCAEHTCSSGTIYHNLWVVAD